MYIRDLFWTGGDEPVEQLYWMLAEHFVRDRVILKDILRDGAIENAPGNIMDVDTATRPYSLIDRDDGIPNPDLAATDIEVLPEHMPNWGSWNDDPAGFVPWTNIVLGEGLHAVKQAVPTLPGETTGVRLKVRDLP